MEHRSKNNRFDALVIILSIVLVVGSIILFSNIAKSNLVYYIGIPIVISLVVATNVTYFRVKKLNNVDFKDTASEYAVKDKFEITYSKDVFVRSVTRTTTISDN